MPVVVGAVAAILVIVLVGNLMTPFGFLGVAEIIATVLIGLAAGVAAGIWESRRRRR